MYLSGNRSIAAELTETSAMKLILFDIDGTLLWTDGAGRRAVGRAFESVMGRAPSLDGFRFDGKTDRQIVHELLDLHGDPAAEDVARVGVVCERYVALLEQELGVSPDRVELLPGVLPLLAALERQPEVVLGLLTGNVREGASLKLRAAGLDIARFPIGAFGSDAVRRAELPGFAMRRAAARFGVAPDPRSVAVVGDTPADVACGLGAGARTVAVATGAYDVATLHEAGAHHVFATLDCTEEVVAALLA